MEYLEGEDLREFLRKRGKIDPMLACELMRQALDGLQEAHACGLVHRDLKPSNLMIIKDHRGQPWVKILDLGLAKMVGGQTDLMTITMDTANQLIGTPAYMSPEAGRRFQSRQPRRSVFHGRGVLRKCWPAACPLNPRRCPAGSTSICTKKAEMPSRYNPDLTKCPQIEKLPMWLLEKKPEDRPQTAAEMVVALKSILAGKSIAELIPNSLRNMGDAQRNPSASGASNAAIPPSTPPPPSAPVQPGLPVAPSSQPRPAVKYSALPAAGARPGPSMSGMTRRPFWRRAQRAARVDESPHARRRLRAPPRVGQSRRRAAAFFESAAAPPDFAPRIEHEHQSRLVDLRPGTPNKPAPATNIPVPTA